jgi:hypothetical protein
MLYAWTLDFIYHDLTDRYFGEDASPSDDAIRPIGILLARPDHTVAREEILPALDYFHHRSGEDITLYCAGYGRYWYEDGMVYNDAQKVAELSDTSPWMFSPKAFSVFVSTLESRTTWTYSGNPELVLLNIMVDREEEDVLFDFSRVLIIDLQDAKADGAISTLNGLMEDIFRLARENRGDLSVGRIGRALGGKTFLKSARDALLRLIPGGLGSAGKSSAHFVVYNKEPAERPHGWHSSSFFLWRDW